MAENSAQIHKTLDAMYRQQRLEFKQALHLAMRKQRIAIGVAALGVIIVVTVMAVVG
jgi:hypothetical protein